MNLILNHTIAAIATAPGVGAIGIVRLSGDKSLAIAEEIFNAKSAQKVCQIPARRVTFGRIYNATELIDEALLLTFHAPNSYTAQDMVEFQTHGGTAILRKVLELCLKHGARLAKPGEFTLRAYLNGQIDLLQAESVLNLINAQSDSARRNAALGLSKALTKEFDLIQNDITKVYGNIQAVFDYPEEGVSESDFIPPLQRALERIEKLLSTAKAGRTIQKGARLALIGKPNVGKSSLLNALLGYSRSIVSNVPGTTRDYLEAALEIAGIPIVAIDTAGIRETEDDIEASGVIAAKEIAANADLSLLLLDVSQPLSKEDLELIANLEANRSLFIASKCDLKQLWQEPNLSLLKVSTKTQVGLAELKEAIGKKLLGEVNSEIWITSERHIELLTRLKEQVSRAMDAPDDLASLDLEEALRSLAELTGRGEIAEEALVHIFANFCVGK